MQQFTVPQFIDVEDKIIGPITSRQFLIMIAAFILLAIFWQIFDFSAFVVFGLLDIAVFGTFAFVRVNSVPFHFFVLNVLQTFKRPHLRVWDKSFGKEMIVDEVVAVVKEEIYFKTGFTSSRLNELSLMVDTQGVYKGEKKSSKTEIEMLEKR